MIAQKLTQLGSRLAEGNSHHLFARFQTKESHITGALQGMTENANGTLTCFFGENLKAEVVDIPKSNLVDVVVFCNAERQPVFLKDFGAEVGDCGGELSIYPKVPPSKEIHLELLEQAREDTIAAYQENVEVFESLRE